MSAYARENPDRPELWGGDPLPVYREPCPVFGCRGRECHDGDCRDNDGNVIVYSPSPPIYVEVEEPVPFEPDLCSRNDWCTVPLDANNEHDGPCVDLG